MIQNRVSLKKIYLRLPSTIWTLFMNHLSPKWRTELQVSIHQISHHSLPELGDIVNFFHSTSAAAALF